VHLGFANFEGMVYVIEEALNLMYHKAATKMQQKVGKAKKYDEIFPLIGNNVYL